MPALSSGSLHHAATNLSMPENPAQDMPPLEALVSIANEQADWLDLIMRRLEIQVQRIGGPYPVPAEAPGAVDTHDGPLPLNEALMRVHEVRSRRLQRLDLALSRLEGL